MFYDALGRLRRVEYGWVAQTGVFPAAPRKLGQDDFYYDALGRRVLVVNGAFCSLGLTEEQAYCFATFVRRTVCDGDQELDEIQMPNTSQYQENDTGPTAVPAGGGFDTNPGPVTESREVVYTSINIQ